MAYRRILNLKDILSKKRAFLFGPRSCGKTFLYKAVLEPTRVYNLLETRTLARLSARPGLVYEECLTSGELIVIDEVQKIPHLLDEVHRTIEEKRVRFLLTGSSARKLKRNQSNLLGGRATRLELLPLTSAEIPEFDLLRYVNHGGIPRHYDANPRDVMGDMEDYVALYLKEEIKDEAATRSLEAFSRFLEIMAIHSGDELVIENFASDCQVKSSTFRNYVDVLKDTLIGFEVPPFLGTIKRKAITRSKFFLFDVGITGLLANRLPITRKSELFGKAFEHWVAMELRAFLSYHRIRQELAYWRSTSQFEVDFVIPDDLAFEVKSTTLVTERDLRGLRALREEDLFKRYIVVSDDPRRRVIDGIEVYPWREFAQALWEREFL